MTLVQLSVVDESISIGNWVISCCANSFSFQQLHEMWLQSRLKLWSPICSDCGWYTKSWDPTTDKALATVSAVILVIAIASGQWVKWLSRYEYPFDNGSGLTISMWTVLNWASGKLKVDNGVTVCQWTLDFWQCMHVLAHLRTSALILGQTYRTVIICWVAWIPRWDSEWKLHDWTWMVQRDIVHQ